MEFFIEHLTFQMGNKNSVFIKFKQEEQEELNLVNPFNL